MPDVIGQIAGTDNEQRNLLFAIWCLLFFFGVEALYLPDVGKHLKKYVR
jgi:hypothetical protein